MLHQPLSGLVLGRGPFLSVYLSTEAAVENAAQQSEVRWKSHRDRLESQGVPDPMLAKVDPLIAGAHQEGEALGVIVRADGAIHVEHHPAPVTDRTEWGPVPSLVPLIHWRQTQLPHVVVMADRAGADIVAVRPAGTGIRSEAGGNTEAITKVKAGGWSQRRYQERAENTWEKNAGDAAEKVARLAGQIDARLIVVAGDVRAVTFLRESLPEDLAGLVREVEGGRTADGSGPSVAESVSDLIDEVVTADTDELLAKFWEESEQKDRAAAGPEATLRALAASQVEVLLVHDDPGDERVALTARQPTRVGHSADDLKAMGVEEKPQAARLVDVAVRAAIATGAGIHVIPAGAGLNGDIGVILRWSPR